MREDIPRSDLIDNEQFKVNLDTLTPTGYSRDSAVNPTELIFAWVNASV